MKDKRAQQQEEEELKEETIIRIEKLKNSKDSNKKLVVVKFTVVAMFVISLYTLILIWVYISTSNFRKILDIVYNIGSLANQIKMAFLIFTEDIARKTLILNASGRSLYSDAHEQGYSIGNKLTQNIKDFPAGYSDFESYFRKLLLESVCSNYLAPVRNIGKGLNNSRLSERLGANVGS
jgi:hypothetical protein